MNRKFQFSIQYSSWSALELEERRRSDRGECEPGENSLAGDASLLGGLAPADERERDGAVAVRVRGAHFVSWGRRQAPRAARQHHVFYSMLYEVDYRATTSWITVRLSDVKQSVCSKHVILSTDKFIGNDMISRIHLNHVISDLASSSESCIGL